MNLYVKPLSTSYGPGQDKTLRETSVYSVLLKVQLGIIVTLKLKSTIILEEEILIYSHLPK